MVFPVARDEISDRPDEALLGKSPGGKFGGGGYHSGVLRRKPVAVSSSPVVSW